MKKKIQKISKYAPSIFQGRIDFKEAARGAALAAEYPIERGAFRSLWIALLLCVALYMYFVGATILNVIARKEALQQTANLASAVSQLEREYFSAAAAIGPSEGGRLGLAPVADTAFVQRPGNAASAATIGGNEI
ncbi:MAG: hypothetical protein HYS26_02790 [Candidatus Kaiserbacteria bacterium]|nr:MAG: hypothetical protein HYS26_02790 [Candidatus Kaiserbacteria bacterium]